MEKGNVQKNNQEKLGCLPFVLGGLSFIPLIGVLFGVIVIIWGIIKIKLGGWKLVLIGTLGILFTIILYGSLFFFGFVQRGGIYDELRGKLTTSMLTDLVKKIEYYKIQKREYPKSLKDLIPENSKDLQGFTMIYDSSRIDFKSKTPRLFYYELINDGKNYYLFSSGIDGIPFTEDDIHPIVSEEEMKNIGYIKKK